MTGWTLTWKIWKSVKNTFQEKVREIHEKMLNSGKCHEKNEIVLGNRPILGNIDIAHFIIFFFQKKVLLFTTGPMQMNWSHGKTL